jgi:hypothetical protein
VPNFYASAPLVSATLNAGEGLFCGASVAPATKHLDSFTVYANAATALPMQLTLLHYGLYYPFVDQGTQDEQLMTQSATLSDGEGFRPMVVVQFNPAAPNLITFQMSYTNSDGVAGRVTPVQSFGAGTHTGCIATTDRTGTTNRSPFVSLQDGDTGVQQIDSFTMLSGVDVGSLAVVLVKPLASTMLLEATAPVEVNFAQDTLRLPVIPAGAYLNMIACPAGSLAATALYGFIDTVWSE